MQIRIVTGYHFTHFHYAEINHHLRRDGTAVSMLAVRENKQEYMLLFRRKADLICTFCVENPQEGAQFP